jgi:hypothetical protein
VGGSHYGIIDNQGELYAGKSVYLGQIRGGDETVKENNPPTKIELGSKVICVSCDDDLITHRINGLNYFGPGSSFSKKQFNQLRQVLK